MHLTPGIYCERLLQLRKKFAVVGSIIFYFLSRVKALTASQYTASLIGLTKLTSDFNQELFFTVPRDQNTVTSFLGIGERFVICGNVSPNTLVVDSAVDSVMTI